MSDLQGILEKTQGVLRSPVAITVILTIAAIGALTSSMAGVSPGAMSLSGALSKRATGPVVIGPGDRRMAYWKKRQLSDTDAQGTSDQIQRKFLYDDGSEIQMLGAYNAPPRWIMVADAASHKESALRCDPQGRPILFQVTRHDGATKAVQSRLTAGFLDKHAFSVDSPPPVSVEIDGVSEDGEMTAEQKAELADILDDMAYFSGASAPQLGG